MPKALPELWPERINAIRSTTSAAIYFSGIALTVTGIDPTAAQEAQRQHANINISDDLIRFGIQDLSERIKSMALLPYTASQFIEMVGLETIRAMAGEVYFPSYEDSSVAMATAASRALTWRLGRKLGVLRREIENIREFANRELSSRTSEEFSALVKQHREEDRSAPHPFSSRWGEWTYKRDVLLTTVLSIGFAARTPRRTLG